MAVNVTDVPEQTLEALTLIPVGAVDAGVTLIVKVTPPVFPEHGEDRVLLTQYVVLEVGETLIEDPVPEMTFEPKVDPVPHWYVEPEPPLAVNVTEDPEQIDVVLAERFVGAVAAAVTLIVVVTPPVLLHGEDCVLLTQ